MINTSSNVIANSHIGVKEILLNSIQHLSTRGLLNSSKWSCEQLKGLVQGTVANQLPSYYKESIINQTSSHEYGSQEHIDYLLAKNYFDLKEYQRCADHLKETSAIHPVNQFLYYYSTYLSSEKRFAQKSIELQNQYQLEQQQQQHQQQGGNNNNAPNHEDDPTKPTNNSNNNNNPNSQFGDGKMVASATHFKSTSKELQQLCFELDKLYNNNNNNNNNNNRSIDDDDTSDDQDTSQSGSRNVNFKKDAFLLYMYSMVLKRKGDQIKARQILLESLHLYPCNWSAWLDLASLCTDIQQVSQLSLPPSDHFMKDFFLAHLLLQLHQTSESLQVYNRLLSTFPNSTYILAQIAICNFNQRAYDVGEELFEKLLIKEPHRLENIDIYSNILYVRDKKASLSMLAHRAMETEKYCPETCCIVGNYYSLKSEHDKAIVYFQRALRLNENYLEAWTLIGQEFLETKNVSMAINAYRRAVDINSKDYRAWYGLGQTYQLLNLPLYSLYYFKKATTLRPYDPRMWCAVGGCYETLQRIQDAIRCYERAEENFDRENVALSKLAKLYQEMQNHEKAAYYYKKNLLRLDHEKVDSKEIINALLFLANYHKNIKQYDECEKYCLRLLDYAGPEKEEAKSLLKDLKKM
ncbi:anaphase promoting complex subunit 8 [Cavenderia fasciculata]|uniref:Anaphase promoting complex subunit 8 n=1 Tax=Cavenderia fasciculata TaxID=261658 RepID=F4PLN6_CACFS|nr:anaphase promoting complex subunit 8 [Cavenderia fasciculata]EGG23458.1 anaphase promoting complex subunit 8 [Cavenderia fasciculata]|eukprot:XP_004361309.1 anaphase promoting complex subunit 8 [Cavenderia fasciculata]